MTKNVTESVDRQIVKREGDFKTGLLHANAADAHRVKIFVEKFPDDAFAENVTGILTGGKQPKRTFHLAFDFGGYPDVCRAEFLLEPFKKVRRIGHLEDLGAKRVLVTGNGFDVKDDFGSMLAGQ